MTAATSIAEGVFWVNLERSFVPSFVYTRPSRIHEHHGRPCGDETGEMDSESRAWLGHDGLRCWCARDCAAGMTVSGPVARLRVQLQVASHAELRAIECGGTGAGAWRTAASGRNHADMGAIALATTAQAWRLGCG